MSGQGLTVAERIRRRPEFERIYSEGARIHGRFMTLFVLPNGGAAPRFGVAATRKLGSAVERNRAKRLAREMFRRHKVAAGLDIVVVPRREMLDAPFPSSKLTTTPFSAATAESARAQPHQAAGPGVRLVLALLRGYKILISPLFTGCCRFQPSCADYTSEAVALHGAARGVGLGLRRLVRCHPFGGHGFDPVPRV